jgi:large subunit ribosomal protein L13
LRTTNSGSEKNNWKKIEKVDTLSYKTVSANKATVQKEWVLIDAKDQILGRLTSVAAKLLRGKHKRNFTPHVDCGDYVIIINAAHIKLSGNKLTDRKYISYSGYPGGQKIKTPAMLLAKRPASLIENSVRGMLPKNRLGREMFRNLHVYAGSDHPHEAQQPKHIDLTSIK